jgi:hypothetical protein
MATAATAAPATTVAAAATATAPATNSPASPGILTMIYDILINPVESKFAELSLFSPAIFTLGSLFISFITLNYPIFLFSIASGEALLLQNVIKGVSSYMATADSIQSSKDIGKSDKCKSKYQGSESTKFKYLLDNGLSAPFPNSALYFLSFASAFCIQSMSFFSIETKERGSAYSSRPYIAYISAGLSIVLFSLFLLLNTCDTPLGVILSVILGLLIGFTLCYQNYLLFGKAGVGLLFIPHLVSRKGMDYICVSTN